MMPCVILLVTAAPQVQMERPLASSANASAIGNVDELTGPWWGDIATSLN